VTGYPGDFGIIKRTHAHFVVGSDEAESGADARNVIGKGRSGV